MTEAQGPSPEDPRKPSVPGPLSRANAPEEDEEFWDLDQDDLPDEEALSAELEPPQAFADPFTKGEAPELVQKPAFSAPPLEPREPKAESRFMVETDLPHEVKSVKTSRQIVLSHVDDAFAALEEGDNDAAPVQGPEIIEEKLENPAEELIEELVEESVEVGEESPVFAIGEAPPVPGAEKRGGFAEETAGLENHPSKVVDLRKSFGEWLSGCSWMEKASLLAVLVMLAGFVVLLFFPAIGSLPDEKERARVEDFPKQGKHVLVKSAKTYWREPIESGPDADVFKRGTVLLPAIEMEVEGGPAVMRVLFRGEDGVVVGDSVTREVNGKQVVKIAGTEGFLELGMHAAYRTGQTKPWIVQVYEANPGSNEIQDFVLIFEMDMSAFLQ